MNNYWILAAAVALCLPLLGLWGNVHAKRPDQLEVDTDRAIARMEARA